MDRVPKYCADIERGSCGMSLETLLTFCKVLNMSPNYVLLGEMEEDELLKDDEELIVTMLQDCPKAKRQYAIELLRVYLKSF